VPETEPQQQLGQIVVDDFRPGIYNTWSAGNGAASAPDGAAQLTGTYGCVASRTGSLIAAPKKVKSKTQALIDANAANKYPTGDARMHIISMRNFSPAYSLVQANQSDYPDAVTVLYSWWYDSAGGGVNFKHRGVARIYKVSSSGTFYDMIAFTAGNTLAVGTKPSHGIGTIDIGRANDTHTDYPGAPVIVATFFGIGTVTQAQARSFPSLTTGGSTNARTDSTTTMVFETLLTGALAIFAHQDRFVILAIGTPETNIGGTQLGSDMGTEQTEFLYYTDVNSVTGGTLENFAEFVAENPFGYGSWKSVNAGELFLVKKRGGGVSIRNDFDRPTVIRLPGIESTGFAINLGCSLPDGTYLYGSERGVYVWSGGDTTQLVSPQLEGWFWKANATENTAMVSPTAGYSVVDQLCNPIFVTAAHPQLMGTWAPCGDRLIFGPNNWCYDSMGKGWFRHSNPATVIYGYHDTAMNNRLVACPYFVDATQTEAIAWFDPMQGQDHYEWVSQPLQKTRGRVIQARGMDVVVQGKGVMTFKLTGLDALESPTATITIDTTKPITVNIPQLTVKSHDIVLHVTSDKGTGTTAPELKRFTIPYYEGETARMRTARP
jgi:hypothetical protein